MLEKKTEDTKLEGIVSSHENDINQDKSITLKTYNTSKKDFVEVKLVCSTLFHAYFSNKSIQDKDVLILDQINVNLLDYTDDSNTQYENNAFHINLSDNTITYVTNHNIITENISDDSKYLIINKDLLKTLISIRESLEQDQVSLFDK